MTSSKSTPPVYLGTTAGFTLLENFIIITILSAMASMLSVAMAGWLDQRQVNQTQTLIYQALRVTQQAATKGQQRQQFSLRQRNDRLEWASHPEAVTPARVTEWQYLPTGVKLASEDNTLPLLKTDNVYYVRFDFHGDVRSSLGTLTLVGGGSRLSYRCVVVSTLIGALRQGEGHSKANSNQRYCY